MMPHTLKQWSHHHVAFPNDSWCNSRSQNKPRLAHVHPTLPASFAHRYRTEKASPISAFNVDTLDTQPIPSESAIVPSNHQPRRLRSVHAPVTFPAGINRPYSANSPTNAST